MALPMLSMSPHPTFIMHRSHTLGLLIAFLTACGGASGSTIILDEFSRVGPSESLTSPFVSPSTATANSYSGYVEVLVSGTGNSLYGSINDAFYGVPSGSPYDGQYYQLNVGWSSFPLVALSGETHNINNFIVFAQGVGAVSPGYTPAYNASHTYHFVVNTGLLGAEQLQFGVSDGIFGDNGGAYNISVWQLEQGGSSVPDSPAPYVTLGFLVVLMGAWLVHLPGAGPKVRAIKTRDNAP